MFHTLRAFRTISARPLVFAAALAGVAYAQAAANPYYIGASQEFVRESNVFRTASRVSDTVSSTGLQAGIDQPFGRQRFYADVSVLANRHENYSELNNVSHTENLGLDWSSMERLSGSLRYMSRQNLADFGLTGGSTAKNIERTQQATALARYGVAARLGLEGSVEHRSVKFSNTDFNSGEYSQNSASAGIRWGAAGLLTLGTGLRVTQGDYPHYKDPFDPLGSLAPETPDRLKRRDLDLTATWSPTGLSTLTARASATHETHSQASRPGFSGFTGALGWDYRLTGKLTLKAQLTRDTGSETTFLTVAPGALPLRANNNRLTTLSELGASYEATAKIGFTANLRRAQGSVTSTGGASLGDSTSSMVFGAKYQPTRSISLGCNAGREHHVNVYNAYTAGCAAQLTLK